MPGHADDLSRTVKFLFSQVKSLRWKLRRSSREFEVLRSRSKVCAEQNEFLHQWMLDLERDNAGLRARVAELEGQLCD